MRPLKEDGDALPGRTTDDGHLDREHAVRCVEMIADGAVQDAQRPHPPAPRVLSAEFRRVAAALLRRILEDPSSAPRALLGTLRKYEVVSGSVLSREPYGPARGIELSPAHGPPGLLR
ncbi:MAG TPA: hypothetical protein VM580_06605 [Labilithrix sp.]|nr:hypothetical protein [Labilithrix sp.]